MLNKLICCFFYSLATDGVDIKSIEIRGEGKEVPVVFSTWDMGGQVIFYPTHQFFLSNAGIYIIVFNMEDIKYPRIEYWMKQIKHIGKECSSLLIMVGTHCENCTEEQIQQIKQSILTKYPRYAYPSFQSKIFPISAKTGQGIRELKKCLTQLAHSSQSSPVVPDGWVQLHEMLKSHRESGTNYVQWSIYSSWALQCGLQSDDIMMATEHLHNSGSLIYFPVEELKNLVILNPQWLADVMSCLITIKNNFVINGYIDSIHFPEIFRNYESSIQSTLILLLEQFKIIHPMNKSKNKYLVPSLLSNARPSAEIAKYYPVELPSGISTLGRIFRFSQLPLGLFGRLMVSILQRPNVTGQVFWRNGIITSTNMNNNNQDATSTPPVQNCNNNNNNVIITPSSPNIKNKNVTGLLLSSKQLQTIVEYESDRYQLSIYIRYSPLDHQMALKEWRNLLEMMKTLIDSFYPQLLANMKELVPCIHCLRRRRYKERVYLFTYSECDNAQTDGFIYCQNIQSPSRCVFISQLAPDIYLADLPRLESSSLEIINLLGEGAYGKVHKAKLQGDIVALKELKVDEANPDSKKIFQEFQTEAYTMSLLNHPNIVRFYGVMLNPPRMIIQYIDGTDLFQFLHPNTNLHSNETNSIEQNNFPWENRILIAFHIAQGLHYLQSINPPVVHRDLRSPNIFITKDFHAVIGDFGLARVVLHGSIGGALRTWQWLAPEIFDNFAEFYDQKTDIYSFGIILWELSSIKIPFDEFRKTNDGSKVQDMDIKKRILSEHLRPTIPKETPKEFAELICKCWSGDPLKRPSTIQIIHGLIKLSKKYKINLPELSNLDNNNYENEDNELNKSIKVSFSTVEPEKISNFSKDPKKLEKDSFKPLAECYLSEANDRCCAALSSGNQVWIGKRDGKITIYSLIKNGEKTDVFEEKNLTNHKRKITQFLFFQNSILSSSEDGSIIVWNKMVSFHFYFKRVILFYLFYKKFYFFNFKLNYFRFKL